MAKPYPAPRQQGIRFVFSDGLPRFSTLPKGASLSFTRVLTDAGIQISMDGRWVDDGVIERLWRLLRYERVCLHAFGTGLALHAGLLRWISPYDTRRAHASLAGRTPDEAHDGISLTTPPGQAPAKASSLKMAA